MTLTDLPRLIAAGQLQDADDVCQGILQGEPDNDAALYWRGIVALQAGNVQAAAQHLQQAVAVNDRNPDYHANLGRALVQLRQTRDAAAAAQRALELQPDNPLTLDTLGVIFSHSGDHGRAVAALERAVEIDPQRASYWFNLGASRKFNGDIAGAEAAYQQALQLDPSLHKAAAALAYLRKQDAGSNHVELYQLQLADFAGDLPDEMRLRYALAKEYDDLGRYTEAFATMQEVAGRWRARVNYAIADDAAMFDALHKGFDESAVTQATAGHESAEPIFIVGMPRTGTTLTERIISSHSSVFAAGELDKFGALIRLAAQARANPDFDAGRIRRVLQEDLAAIGGRYIASTRPATGHTPHFIDKMPLNFLYAGFILLALPQAKVICVRRNPMDTCLSNFRQLFSLRSAYYAYSYDILDCGRYYLMFDKLMHHWDTLFPGRIHTVQYETLVQNQEAESRALIDYCGLPWEDACLSFEKNAAPVATASSSQVREPIYTSALARWKHYERELQPLAEFFTANGVTID